MRFISMHQYIRLLETVGGGVTEIRETSDINEWPKFKPIR